MRESRGKKDEKRSGRARLKAEWVQWQSVQVQCSRTKWTDTRRLFYHELRHCPAAYCNALSVTVLVVLESCFFKLARALETGKLSKIESQMRWGGMDGMRMQRQEDGSERGEWEG